MPLFYHETEHAGIESCATTPTDFCGNWTKGTLLNHWVDGTFWDGCQASCPTRRSIHRCFPPSLTRPRSHRCEVPASAFWVPFRLSQWVPILMSTGYMMPQQQIVDRCAPMDALAVHDTCESLSSPISRNWSSLAGSIQAVSHRRRRPPADGDSLCRTESCPCQPRRLRRGLGLVVPGISSDRYADTSFARRSRAARARLA